MISKADFTVNTIIFTINFVPNKTILFEHMQFLCPIS